MEKSAEFVIDAIRYMGDKSYKWDLYENLNWKEIYKIAMLHSVAPMVAYALKMKKCDMPKNISDLWTKQLLMAVILDENQQREWERLSREFSKLNLDYMPMKGIILKKMYPESYIRTMGDIDVLIRYDNLDSYINVVEYSGYVFEHESVTEHVYKKPPYVNLELHKYIINPQNLDMYDYYGDGWCFCKKNDKNEFCFGDEDMLIYTLVHFAKHYRNSGVGIRPLVDLWLMIKQKDIDWKYVNEQFAKLNLTNFAYNTLKLIDVWFEGKEGNETTDEMAEFLINNGVFGNEKNMLAARSLSNGYAKKGKIIGKILLYNRWFFSTKESTCKAYPVLERKPYLFPVYYVVWMVKNQGKLKQKLYESEMMFGRHVSEIEMHMERVGIDILKGKQIRSDKK